MSKTLTVFLAADVSKLNSGLNRGKRQLKDFEDSSTSLGTKLSGMVGPALIGATAAAGAFAVSLAIDGVKAALEDEKAVAKLSTTMKNLGFPEQTANVLSLIDGLQRATGVSEDMLRPAFERLAIATGDVGMAQTTLQLAMDISAGTGKSLEAVANALGKAYEGNTGALGKLGTGIDKAVLKTGDMKQITGELSKTFEGQASAAADTWAGKVARLSVGFNELKESFGSGFLDGLSSASGGVDNLMIQMQQLEPQMKALGKTTGTVAINVLTLSGDVAALWTTFSEWSDNNGFVRTLMTIANHVSPLSWAFEALKTASGAVSSLSKETWTRSGPTAAEQAAYINYNKNTEKLKPLITGNTTATNAQSSALKKQQDILMGLYNTQLEVFNGAKDALKEATSALDDWNSKIQDYAKNLQGNILSGTSLSDALSVAGTDASKEAGKTTADIFVEKLQKSIDFGRTLKELQASGAKDNLIQQVAAIGPEAGLSLAQELIDKGLVPGLQSKLDQAESAAMTVAQSLVPPFLTAGRDAAQATLLGAMAEFDRQKTILEAIGAAVGKTLGNAAAKEIADAIAAAYKAMGTNAPSGAASDQTIMDQVAAGAAAAAAATIAPNAIGYSGFDTASYVSAYLNAGQDIGRVILQANNRNGWWETPTISPVLG